MLLANKLDRADRRQVTASAGQGLAKVQHIWIFKASSAVIYSQSSTRWFTQQHQALFYECSATTGCNVEEAMTELVRYDVSCF